MAAPTLIQQTGRAAFWNTALLPLKAVIGLAFSILVAQRFGLDAGIYNIAMGLVTSAVMFTNIGIPTSLTKFLPEIRARAGSAAVGSFLIRVVSLRLLLLVFVIVPILVAPARLANLFDLGDQGVFIMRLAAALIAARATFDLCICTMHAFFDQLRSNLLDILHGLLDVVLAGAGVALGFSIGGVFGMVMTSGVLSSLVALAATRGSLAALGVDDSGTPFAPRDPGATRAAVAAESSRFAGFAVFTFLFQISLYFSDRAFANSALGIVLGSEQVAVFSYGYTLVFMSVGLMVSSFRGVYRPMFAHLRTRDDPDQLRRAFEGVSKVQLIILVPAGVGLFVMMPDYMPLLFGDEFAPSVPIARVFTVLLYTNTAFNLGMIWLSTDERYRAVLATQSVSVLVAPLFLLVAATQGLVAAAMVLGGARLTSNLTAYLLCRRGYGFRFPFAFAARILAVAAVMAVVLLVARQYLAHSGATAIGLTLAGASIYLLGLRVARILGPEEIDLLHRSDVPGKGLVVAWLAPGEEGRS